MAASAAPRQDTLDRILSLLAKQSRLTARQIVDALGITRSTVNQALYGPLRGKVVQDSSYRWSLAGADARPSTSPRAAPKTELGRLCRYCLECVAWDAEDGVSAYASSRHDLDYVELDRWPFEDTTVLERDVVRQFIGRVSRDRTRVLHVGYPVRLRHVRARSGWQGFRVEPVLLFDFDDTAFVCDPLPHLNYAVLKALPRTGSGQIIDEAIELANELGLADAGHLLDPEDVVLRLRQVRPEWDWREAIDPYDLSTRQAVGELNQVGIYNRAILIASERSRFIRGLETELHRLSELDEYTLGGTALSDWLSRAVWPPSEAEASPAAGDPAPEHGAARGSKARSPQPPHRRHGSPWHGEKHHRAWDGELWRRDQLRNMRLIELGWEVMRFWVYEVRDNLPEVVNKSELELQPWSSKPPS